MIFRISRNGHMIWGGGLINLSRELDRLVIEAGFRPCGIPPSRELGNQTWALEGVRSEVLPCGHCGLKVKVGTTRLGVGPWAPTTPRSDESMIYPDVSSTGDKK